MQKLVKYFKSEKFNSAKPIIVRLVIFLTLFVIASGILGPRIISQGLVGRYGFQVYGGAGKGLLFSLIVFAILVWRKKKFPNLLGWDPVQLFWLACGFIILLIDWGLINNLISGNTSTTNILLAHFGILASIIVMLIASFGLKNIRRVFLFYYGEIYISLLLGMLFVGFVYLIYGLWTVLCSIVLSCVKELLKLNGIQTVYEAPRTLIFNRFAINVAEYCSGIESIALFTALYALVGALDWEKLNTRKYVGIFIPTLILLFVFNILRVYVLILGGYYINPQIAFSLFHTYAGMVFFILYSAIFWLIAYRWMIKSANDSSK